MGAVRRFVEHFDVSFSTQNVASHQSAYWQPAANACPCACGHACKHDCGHDCGRDCGRACGRAWGTPAGALVGTPGGRSRSMSSAGMALRRAAGILVVAWALPDQRLKWRVRLHALADSQAGCLHFWSSCNHLQLFTVSGSCTLSQVANGGCVQRLQTRARLSCVRLCSSQIGGRAVFAVVGTLVWCCGTRCHRR